MLLPNNGCGIRAEWQADERDTLPNMPGEFVDSGFDNLTVEATEDALAQLVSEILGRMDGLDDERVDELNTRWRAIRDAEPHDEARFCVVAGRLGLDPYDPAEMVDDLATFIESTLGDAEFPVARDLTEVANAESVAGQWSWVQRTTATLKLGPITKSPPIEAPVAGLSPSQYGYQLAARVRNHAGLDPSMPVNSIQQVAQAVAAQNFIRKITTTCPVAVFAPWLAGQARATSSSRGHLRRGWIASGFSSPGDCITPFSLVVGASDS